MHAAEYLISSLSFLVIYILEKMVVISSCTIAGMLCTHNDVMLLVGFCGGREIQRSEE